MKPSPNRSRKNANRSAGTNGSPSKRNPRTRRPWAQRRATASRFRSPQSIVRLRDGLTGMGNDGWDSTGATTTGSTAMARAKPPENHIPTTPTPGPPHRSCSRAARARSQPVIGEDRPVASTVNSWLTHAPTIVRSPATRSVSPATSGSRPGVPNRSGRTAVHPSATTRSANPSTWGEMPGIGHLGDHDDRGAAALAEDLMRHAVVGEALRHERRQITDWSGRRRLSGHSDIPSSPCNTARAVMPLGVPPHAPGGSAPGEAVGQGGVAPAGAGDADGLADGPGRTDQDDEPV